MGYKIKKITCFITVNQIALQFGFNSEKEKMRELLYRAQTEASILISHYVILTRSALTWITINA